MFMAVHSICVVPKHVGPGATNVTVELVPNRSIIGLRMSLWAYFIINCTITRRTVLDPIFVDVC